MRRGMVRYSRGKYAGSVADFTEALRLDPDDDQTIKLRKLSAAKQLEVRLTSLTSVWRLTYVVRTVSDSMKTESRSYLASTPNLHKVDLMIPVLRARSTWMFTVHYENDHR